jgi:heptosyltransferase-3
MVNIRSDSSFLIVSLRYLGDVLLSTPIALSIKESFPQAQIDYLVFEGTEGVLKKNPLLRSVITMPPESRDFSFWRSFWRKYDYALGTNFSDRTTFFCACAGSTSLAFTPGKLRYFWRNMLLTKGIPYDVKMHLVPMLMSLLEPLGIPPVPRVTMACDRADETFVQGQVGKGEYIVLHPYSRKSYKQWTAEGWSELAALIRDELRVTPLFTCSPNPQEKQVMEEIRAASSRAVEVLKEPYTFNQLAALLKNAKGYVGVDTIVTHMAAALEVPTVALFGATPVMHWGPWPNDYTGKTPYEAKGRIQRTARATVIQKEWECVPCNRETCTLSGKVAMECMGAIAAYDCYFELRNVLERAVT